MQELHSVRDQLLDETGRASKLEVGESSLVNGQKPCSMIWWTGGIRILDTPFCITLLGLKWWWYLFPLPNWQHEVSEIQQRLQKVATLEKEFELLQSERGGRSDKSASGGNKKPGGVGFRRWYGDGDERWSGDSSLGSHSFFFGRFWSYSFWSPILVLTLKSLKFFFRRNRMVADCGIKWSTVPITSETWYRPHFFISICRFYWFTYKLLAASWY